VNLEDVLRWAPLPAGATLPVHDPVLEANSGTWTRMGRRAAGSDAGALPITLVTELFLDGALPGQREAVGDWVPLMGIHDIRLLDTF